MPNRNRHRSTQQMNTPAGRPIVAVQVNPAQLWAEQPTVVVNAEICPDPVQQDPQNVVRLKDQVAQLKKANKEHKKNFKMLSKTQQDCQFKFEQAVVRWDVEREHAERHTNTMWVESTITDYCLTKKNETIISFDCLKHPSEMPSKLSPEVRKWGGDRLDQLDAKTKKDGEDLPICDNPDGYRYTVQKVKGVPQWDGIEEDDPRVNPKMVVHPQFTMTAQDYLSGGGHTRHWLATWNWAGWTTVCDKIEMKYKGQYQEVWDKFPQRFKQVPQLNTDEIFQMKKLITLSEDLIHKKSGVRKQDIRFGENIVYGDNDEVDKIVKSAVKNIKNIFQNSLVKRWTNYLCDELKLDEQSPDGSLDEKMWF